MGGQLYFPEKTDRATNTNITTSETVEEEEEEELCVAHDTEICVDDDVDLELRLPECQILRASTKKLSQPATRKDRDKMIQILKILY